MTKKELLWLLHPVDDNVEILVDTDGASYSGLCDVRTAYLEVQADVPVEYFVLEAS
jgi:hypothetical protein